MPSQQPHIKGLGVIREFDASDGADLFLRRVCMWGLLGIRIRWQKGRKAGKFDADEMR